MGLKEKSGTVSVLLGVLLVSVAVAELAFVVVTKNESVRVFLVSSALGIFVVLGMAALRVMKNDNDVDDAHARLATPVATDCPDFWTRTWNKCAGNYDCSPEFTLPDGSKVKMRESMQTLNLASFNSDTSEQKCLDTQGQNASFPFTEMLNRCTAYKRMA